MQLRHRTLAEGCYRILLALVILTSVVHAEQDKQVIRRKVKRHIQKLLACYEVIGVVVGVVKRMRFPRSREATKVTYPIHIDFAGQ